MPTPRHPEDHLLYEKFLEETRDEDGVVHRDEAVKLLLAELLEDPDRVAEYAEARAQKVADGFDQSHKPEIENGQMALDIDTYLVIGDNERVGIDDAQAHHTRQWLDIQNIQKARHDMAHGAKTMHGYRLLAVQEEHGCSMWQAEQ
ncbi:hypothetical protein ACFQ34_33535, partial [Pseudonocardia benzenivorans]